MSNNEEHTRHDAYSTLALSVVWVGLLAGLPFTFASAFGLPYRVVNITAAAGVVLLIGVLVSADINRFRINLTLSSILLVQATLFAFLALYHSDPSYISSVVLPIAFAALICLVIDSMIGWERFARSYVRLMCVVSILAAIGFSLALIGALDPLSSYQNPDGRPAMNFVLTFTNVAWPIGGSWFIRPSGYFDEPGTLGFFISFALISNRYLKGTSAVEKILLIGGFASTSLGFYLFAVFYLAVANPRFLGLLVIGSSLAFSAIIGVSDARLSPIIERLKFVTIDRIMPARDSKKLVQGDNRTKHLTEAARAWATNPSFGVGRSYIDDPRSEWYRDFLGANPLAPFAMGGIVGGIATYFLPMIIISFIFLISITVGMSRDELLISGLLVLSSIHRPFFTTPLIIVIMIGILVLLNKKYAHWLTKRRYDIQSAPEMLPVRTFGR